MWLHFEPLALKPRWRFGGTRGQASVEAALLIPIVLAGMLIAAQPAISLYDRMVMEAAAAEGCRVLETLPEADSEEAQAYVRRRLEAIPSVAAFHEGAWSIEVAGAGQQSAHASVRISHVYRPLPLIGSAMGLVGLADGDGRVRQEVFRQVNVHDDWALHSSLGLQFDAWVGRWDDKA